MLTIFDPALVYGLTVLKRLLLMGAAGSWLMHRFTGNPEDMGTAIVCLVAAIFLALTVRRRR